ncbi:MAG: hypothetical protein AAAB16_19815 [Pseudomonas sp.]|uniref:hypothetical protein n=1 Tax=Pseudomonas sp. TaxID=306 RepID=UPI0030F2F2D4
MKNAFCLLVLSSMLAGCSGFKYGGYQGEFNPAAMPPYDLSQQAPTAALIYFNTYTAREAGIAVHRLLLATHVDGQVLPNASATAPARGYQALKVAPGKHSLQWCWLSKNTWGPGGERCGFKAEQVEFKAGQRYVVSWTDAKAFEGQATFVRINAQIENLDTHEVVFRQQQ